MSSTDDPNFREPELGDGCFFVSLLGVLLILGPVVLEILF